MTNTITYEFPLNERIRTFLKLEDLFQQMAHLSIVDDEWNNRAELSCLLNILAIAKNADLKTELAKEIDRHIKSLALFSKNPGVDSQKLNRTIEQLLALNTEITGRVGRIDQKVHTIEILKRLHQRNNIPGGTCDFDMPAYHFWLNQPLQFRRQQIVDWSQNLKCIEQAIKLLLQIIRHSATSEQQVAHVGFFQKNLSNHQNAQLIRISIEKDSPYFAEISGGKHRFTLRFMELKLTERAVQSEADCHFTLQLCQI